MEVYIKERDFIPPTRVFGNLYFVGTRPASAHIVDTGEGIIIFDTGYLEMLPVVIENMSMLGFSAFDIKYIFLTHGHIDHLGGAKALRDMTGAKTVLGRADREYANGRLDLTYAKELGLEYNEAFEPDILLDDGDTLTLGNTTVLAVATPGHTPGAMSYFFNVTDGASVYRAGLHGGMGTNTLTREFLEKYSLPFTLRDDFRRSMLRLAKEKVDIFLGNHMQHNKTPEKMERLLAGDKYAFVNPGEWSPYSLWCIKNLDDMVKKEIEK
jgi:metallo-beta-lactamase class B